MTRDPTAQAVGSSCDTDEAWKALRGRSIEHLVREDVVMSSAPVAAEVLNQLGFETRLVFEGEADLSTQSIVYMGGNPRSYRKTLRRLATIPPAERPVVIVWHTEPLPMPRSAGLRPERLTLRELGKVILRDRRINDHYSNARYLRALASKGLVDAFAVAAKAYQAYLAEEGVALAHVPLGYHPSQGRLLEMQRDIDVLFLGEFRLRRRRRILRDLRKKGLEILTLCDYSDPRLWGESRTELLNRTKIMLHIPRLEGHCSDIRMNISMATGALVVSEPLCLPHPFVPGVHYVESSTENLVHTIRRYLSDEQARMSITEAGHQFVTTELTLEESFRQLLCLASDAVSRKAT